MLLLELIFAVIALLLIWDYWNKKHRNDLFNRQNISGPKAYPIIGSALEFVGLDTEKIMEFSKMNKEKYGNIYRIWVMNTVTVNVSDAKYLEGILSSQQLITKSSFYDFLLSWLGTGLLLSTGRKWHSRRKIITPTFHFKILEQFVEVFDQQSAVLVKKLYSLADEGKTAVNIAPLICLMALDVIAETAMGVKINAQHNQDIEYVQAVANAAEITAHRFVTPSEHNDLFFRLTKPQVFNTLKKSIDIMHRFTDHVIEQRRLTLTESVGNSQRNQKELHNDIGTKPRMAFLDVLLQSTINGKPLSNADIREEVDTFMFEGHDTTTSGVSFCLYLISRHAEVQQKIWEEIVLVLGTDKDRTITYRELQELKYLECVIKETLRLYPSVPVIGRMTTEDIQIGDLILPANIEIRLNFFLAQRDPKYFPDPESFRPERFNTDSNEKVNPFAYVPFSAGPRNCIGQKFAMLEMKSAVSKVLRHFELLPLGPNVRPKLNLILRSANSVHIGLKPRRSEKAI